MHELALGTAQLGMPYGIANSTGQPALHQARDIVATCWRGGIRFFDTARAYGDSEKILGHCLRGLAAPGEARIISKLDPRIPIHDLGALCTSVESSLRDLGIDRLWALLLHREDLLEQWDGPMGRGLCALKRGGLVERLGVSVYSTEGADRALEIPEIEVLQVPANVFDRRMRRRQVFERADRRGCHVFLRSVYLQGLVLMPSRELAPSMDFARPAVAAYEDFCRQEGWDRKAFALAHARSSAPRAHLVLGAETWRQCEENLGLIARTSEVDPAAWDSRWPDDDPRLVDPRQWP